MLNDLSMPKTFMCGVLKIDLISKQIIESDDQFLTMTGYTELDLKSDNHKFDKIILKEDYSRIIDNLDTAIRNKQPLSCNCRMLNKNGNLIHAIIHVEIIDCLAKIIVQDITNYIMSYESIEQNYQEISLLTNVSSAAFCFNAKDGEFGIISSTLAELFGYTCQEFLQHYNNNFYEIIHEQDKERVQAAINDQLRESDHVEVEFRICNKVDNFLWIIFKGKRIKYKDDAFYFYGSLVDITELKTVQYKLYEMNIKMNAMVSNIPAGIGSFIIDKNGISLLYANDEYYRLLGYTKNEYDNSSSKTICKFLYEKDYPIIEQSLKRKIDENEILEFEVRVKTKNRGIIWISVKSKFYKYVNQNPVYYSIILDIDERKKMEYEMKLQTERYKLIEEITDEVQLEYDVINDALFIPRKFNENKDKHNYINKFWIGGKVKKLIYHEDYNILMKAIQKAIMKPSKGVLEFRIKTYCGDCKWYRIHYISISSEDGVVIRLVGRIKNINDEKSKQELLEQRLKADPLTDLLNKVEIKYTINKFFEKTTAEGFHAMLLIDIDNFKKVNDTLGHIMGDTVILDIAQVIKSVFRVSDYLGRVGGDEFLVFIKNTNKDAVKNKARELCDKINHKYKNDKGVITVSCSIGISYYPDEGNNYDELFSKSDLAMYYSKMQGGNYFISYEEIVESI